MANPFEGLSYVINTPAPNPEARFREFKTFVTQGREGRTSRGLLQPGVIDWLIHLPVAEARFFKSETRAAGTLVVTTLSRNDVPWILIPGFEQCLLPVGQVSPDFRDVNRQINLEAISDLDDEFRTRVANRVRALAMIPAAEVDRFVETLRDPQGDRDAAVLRLPQPIQIQVRALLSL